MGKRNWLRDRINRASRSVVLPFSLLLGVVSGLAEGVPAVDGFTVLDGARVHYTSRGAGDHALVLVHGWSCDQTVWKRNAPGLAESTRVIAIDLLGHGQSDTPDIAYTLDLQARAVAAVLDHAQVKRATLVGHSLGTAVIRQFYRRYPERVRALVIVDGALRPFGDAAMLERFLAPLRGPDYEQAAGRSIDGMTQQMEDASLRAEIKAIVVRTPQRVAVSEMEATLDPALWKPDKIDVPVLMILAKSPMWTGDYEQFVRSFIPKLQLETWDGVSHFLMMEKPAEFDETVVRFVKENGLPNS